MKYDDICCYAPINDTEEEKVAQIAESIKKNGCAGCPILVCGGALLTGSHRLAALKSLENDESVDLSKMEVAEDVTEIVENALKKFEAENGYIPDIDYSDIGWMFSGTWVEQYKDEIAEW